MPVRVSVVPHVDHVARVLLLELLGFREELEGASLAEESVEEEDVLVRVAINNLHIQVDCRSWQQ